MQYWALPAPRFCGGPDSSVPTRHPTRYCLRNSRCMGLSTNCPTHFFSADTTSRTRFQPIPIRQSGMVGSTPRNATGIPLCNGCGSRHTFRVSGGRDFPLWRKPTATLPCGTILHCTVTPCGMNSRGFSVHYEEERNSECLVYPELFKDESVSIVAEKSFGENRRADYTGKESFAE